jgi:hypothetical protein
MSTLLRYFIYKKRVVGFVVGTKKKEIFIIPTPRVGASSIHLRERRDELRASSLDGSNAGGCGHNGRPYQRGLG